MHPLDNVIWKALTTRQTDFAQTCDQACRFLPDVSLLAAFPEPSEQGYASLARLVETSGTAGLFLEAPYQPRPGWTVVRGAPLLEMICEDGVSSRNSVERSAVALVELGDADSPEMLELAALTNPGPFSTRTHQLGTFLGIRLQGKLVAMAGERLKIPGFTEVSAVCTHPDHLGKGYARTLMTEVMQRIRDRGEIPILHVREDNVRAIEIYKRLGFRERTRLHYVVLQKA